ncbi:lipopolysaccharide assembly protein LapA domain-containing protein [Salimicrobium sp. PL1-032A]|uniref:LapA family protein n=1 Tax=Salimicrobium sp. PL1-032A TaxID=3095364 RepID=UPI0032619537
MKGQSYIILAIVFALLVAIFAVINVEPVQVNYLFGTGEAPLILVILISVLMGGVITASVGALRYFRLKRDYKNLEKKAQTNESESVAAETSENGEDSVNRHTVE